MNFEDFFKRIEQKEIRLTLKKDTFPESTLLDNEALFQLPLICLIILLMAKDRAKPLVPEVGQLVGECIESTMHGFKGSAQHLGWSANLRLRTVKAIGFLELAQLIEIDSRNKRINISKLGRKIIDKALSRDDDLTYNLSTIAREYRNICVSKRLDMELS
jgi:hypothetical protein